MRTKGRELQQQQQQQHSENGSGAGDKPPTPWSRPPNSSNTPAAKRPAATLEPEPASPDTFPPLTSFATRRRQSQNSAGADKAAKLSIRPPPSPYQSSAGSEYKVNHLMPTIHSAPPAGWAMRQEQQQQQRPPGGGAGGLKLPVVPPVFGARPGMPDTPRTAVPLPQRRPMFLNSPLPGRLTGGPRTAGLPSTHSHLSTQQQMGPPSAVPPRGGGGGYVQPIATARPSFGGGSSSNLDREKQAFLAPFESFYDTLADARRLKVWLAEQLQRSGQYDARVERLEREVDGLRRRVAELEGAPPAGGSTNSNNGPHADLPPSPPTLHSHTSAVRLEPAPTPSRSAAPEPSPIPTALNGGGATPAAGTTLSPPLRMVGPRISSPRAPTHHAATASPQLPPNGLKKRMDVEGPARTASR
ncbi:hypothetical protein EXIGLDRAFT_718590 [Exidia glandulosa HHB12029]|uniref:Uncharacterized protein n=1 Tax=Exidia glandulosa HHB12029 TaxID=1314781 RepID=A0A165HMS1_EXIGL|nr:hypothetical protein EXIGLDRAFT_718590 [Exidia glandulosa HHB12029]